MNEFWWQKEYITKKDILETLQIKFNGNNEIIEKCKECVEQCPKVEVTPLIRADMLVDEDGNIECSNCGSPECWGNFCMNCGAKMTERKANEDNN